MIQARNIVKRYGDIAVLRGIDIDIEAGAVTSIVGASGAGKTTLLQVLGTLTAPDSGTVIYDGEEVSAMSDARLSRFRNAHIGFNIPWTPAYIIGVVCAVAYVAGCCVYGKKRAAKLLAK